MSRLSCSSFARSTQTVPETLVVPVVPDVPTAPVVEVELEVELVDALPINVSICAVSRAIVALSIVADWADPAVGAGGWLVTSVLVVGWVCVEWVDWPLWVVDEGPAGDVPPIEVLAAAWAADAVASRCAAVPLTYSCDTPSATAAARNCSMCFRNSCSLVRVDASTRAEPPALAPVSASSRPSAVSIA
jgi:hypothetical protein